MPKTVNPIRKKIVKTALKRGESAREALRQANYGKGPIGRSTANKVVKDSMKEILEEYDTKDVNTEFVLKHLLNLIKTSSDSDDRSNYNRAVESLGRHLAMFTDKKEVETKVSAKDMMKEVLIVREENRISELIDE